MTDADRRLRRAQHRVRRDADRDRGPGRARGRGSRSWSPASPATDGIVTLPAPGRSRRAPTRELTVVERFTLRPTSRLSRSPWPRCDAGHGRPSALPRSEPARPSGVADRRRRSPAPTAASSTLLATVALGGDYARVRTDARLEGQGAVGQSDRRVLRRGASRCTTSAPCRTMPHRRPRPTSSSRARSEGHSRSVYTRADPGAQRSAGHHRLPDQPQPQAERRCVGRQRAQPRDRDQRRPLQSRVSGRPRSTRSSASTSRAAACPRASAERLIVLGFFDEVLERLPVPDLAGPAASRRSRPSSSRRDVDDRASTCARSVTTARQARHACSTSVACPSASCASATTSTPSATPAATPTCRCPRARCSCDDCEIECWKHGSTFSLATGEPQTLPATHPVPVYAGLRRRRRSS